MKTAMRVALALPWVALSSCQSTTTSTGVSSLDRPLTIGFACFEDATSTFVADPSACDGMTGASTDTHRVIALVLQRVRGEVATIDWKSESVVDSDRTVPGFTFVRVGETPTDLLVPSTDARMAYVANYGSYSVEGIPVATFYPDAIADASLRRSTVTLPSAPTDLAFAEAGGRRYLFATLPEAGQIAQFELAADGSLGAPTYLAMSATVPAQVADAGGATYARLCPTDTFVRPPTAAPRSPVSRGATARPSRIAVLDTTTGPELVATDENLPMLHRLTVGAAGATEVAGFAVGVPTLDVATTPKVPSTHVTATAPVTLDAQYVYAIDATDRSVLALDVATGAVLAVQVGDLRPDRIPTSAPVSALDVLTPAYDPASDPTLTARCDPSMPASGLPDDASVATLRGVFLAATADDGTVQLVDVYDLDAACRGTTACGGFGNTNDERPAIRRHHPRIGALVTVSPSVSSDLVFAYDGSAGRLASTGEPSTGDGPGLLPVDDGDPATAYCPGTTTVAGRGAQRAVLTASGDASVEGQPLVCLLDDTHAVRRQRWVATYEGPVPASSGVRGRFDTSAGVRLMTDDADFCRVGVVGRADVVDAGLASDDPEFGYGGDMLVLTAEPSPDRVAADRVCEELTDATSGRRIRLAIAIESASHDELVLGGFVRDAAYTVASTINAATPEQAVALLAGCYPDSFSYEVRVRAAYLVSSSDGVARHRVVEDNTGRCVLDASSTDLANPDTVRSFRALPGRTFLHPQVSFRISQFAVASGVSAQLVFDVEDVPSFLRIDGGTLPTAAAFNPADDRLYVVDPLGNRVLQYGTTPLSLLDTVR